MFERASARVARCGRLSGAELLAIISLYTSIVSLAFPFKLQTHTRFEGILSTAEKITFPVKVEVNF